MKIKRLNYVFWVIFTVSISFSCQDELETSSIAPTAIKPGEEIKANSTSSDTYDRAMYYFHRGNSAKGIYYGAKDNIGTTWPYYNDVDGSEETVKGPAAIFFNDLIYVFYRGDNTDRIYYKTTSDGIGWSPEQTIGTGITTTETPAPVIYNGTLYLYHTKLFGVIRVTSTTNGSTWSHTSQQGALVYNAASQFASVKGVSATVFNNQIVLAFTYRYTSSPYTNDRQMYTATSTNGTSFSQPQFASTAKSNVGPFAMAHNGILYIAYSDASTDNLSLVSTSNFSSFTFKTITVGGGNARTDDQPSMIHDGSRFVIVYKGGKGNRNLFQAYATNTLTTWSGNTHIPGESIAGPYLVRTNW